MKRLRNFFEIDRLKTSFRREFLAGTTTFVTMAYIVAVNPAILGEAGMPYNAVLFATVFCSSLACILMGVWANKPFALAPGMGMNAYVTFYVVKTLGVPWQTALGIVFISGVLNVILSLSPIRTKVIDSIPLHLKNAIAVGVGIFIALIGLKTAGILAYEGVTLTGFGKISVTELLMVLGGIAAMGLLYWKKVAGSILIVIGIITALGVIFKIVTPPDAFVSVPTGMLDSFLKLDILGALAPKLWSIIVALFIIDFFSSVGTFIGVSLNTNLQDEQGRLPKMKESLIADSLATPFGALFGTTSITTYIETAAGVRAGGRTGVTAIVVAIWMIPMLFLAPILKIIPAMATAPALIFVGILMMAPIMEIRRYKLAEIVSFLVLVIATSLTFAIDQGMLYGFGIYIILKAFKGELKDISPFLYVTTGILLVGKIVQLF
jgi:adenine/guanine/hypoxanthine permease